MERELKHLHTAIIDMRNAVRSGRPGAPLASAIMNSRNWLLSVLMSHTYVQDMLRGDGTGLSGASFPALQLDVLTPRAIKAGLEDAKRDRG